MKKPNFFILGGPKCGTTSLVYWLSAHPEIFMSPVKEPHFFSKDFSRGDIESLSAYENLFYGAGEGHVAVGEASTEYLYSKVAVSEIEKTYKSPRYIVMVRSPVDLAYSLYNYEKEGGREVVQSFEEAWAKSPERRLGRWVGRRCTDPKWLDYQKVACLGEQLRRLLGSVDRERVLILVLDDVKANPRKEYIKVLDFLGVRDDGCGTFKVENAATQSRSVLLASAIHGVGAGAKKVKKLLGIPVYKGSGVLTLVGRLNARKVDSSAMQPAIRREMQEYFHSDVELLSSLLGRDLMEWVVPKGGQGSS